jgi:hypothetical protein
VGGDKSEARGRNWNGTGGQRADQVAKGRDECEPMWSGPRGSEAEKRAALFALFRGAAPSLPAVVRDKARGRPAVRHVRGGFSPSGATRRRRARREGKEDTNKKQKLDGFSYS